MRRRIIFVLSLVLSVLASSAGPTRAVSTASGQQVHIREGSGLSESQGNALAALVPVDPTSGQAADHLHLGVVEDYVVVLARWTSTSLPSAATYLVPVADGTATGPAVFATRAKALPDGGVRTESAAGSTTTQAAATPGAAGRCPRSDLGGSTTACAIIFAASAAWAGACDYLGAPTGVCDGSGDVLDQLGTEVCRAEIEAERSPGPDECEEGTLEIHPLASCFTGWQCNLAGTAWPGRARAGYSYAPFYRFNKLTVEYTYWQPGVRHLTKTYRDLSLYHAGITAGGQSDDFHEYFGSWEHFECADSVTVYWQVWWLDTDQVINPNNGGGKYYSLGTTTFAHAFDHATCVSPTVAVDPPAVQVGRAPLV